MEKYRDSDGNFQFKLCYPELNKSNEWIQSSNPAKETTITGFKPISLAFKTNGIGQEWAGLGKSSSISYQETLIDDSPAQKKWHCAIGSCAYWPGEPKIPGPRYEDGITKVNLYMMVPQITKDNFTRMDDERNCSNVQIFKCNETNVCPCIMNCALSQWSNWSPCDGNCEGIGFTRRTRKVIEKEKFDGTCDQNLEERKNCTVGFKDWSVWSSCNISSCGEGTKSRMRQIETASEIFCEDVKVCHDCPIIGPITILVLVVLIILIVVTASLIIARKKNKDLKKVRKQEKVKSERNSTVRSYSDQYDNDEQAIENEEILTNKEEESVATDSAYYEDCYSESENGTYYSGYDKDDIYDRESKFSTNNAVKYEKDGDFNCARNKLDENQEGNENDKALRQNDQSQSADGSGPDHDMLKLLSMLQININIANVVNNGQTTDDVNKANDHLSLEN